MDTGVYIAWACFRNGVVTLPKTTKQDKKKKKKLLSLCIFASTSLLQSKCTSMLGLMIMSYITDFYNFFEVLGLTYHHVSRLFYNLGPFIRANVFDKLTHYIFICHIGQLK